MECMHNHIFETEFDTRKTHIYLYNKDGDA